MSNREKPTIHYLLTLSAGYGGKGDKAMIHRIEKNMVLEKPGLESGVLRTRFIDETKLFTSHPGMVKASESAMRMLKAHHKEKYGDSADFKVHRDVRDAVCAIAAEHGEGGWQILIRGSNASRTFESRGLYGIISSFTLSGELLVFVKHNSGTQTDYPVIPKQKAAAEAPETAPETAITAALDAARQAAPSGPRL